MANRRDMAECLTLLGSFYPDRVADFAPADWDRMITAYLLILGDLGRDLLLSAAVLIASRSSFWPRAAELRSAAFEIRDMAQPAPLAGDAWAEVLAIARRADYVAQPNGSYKRRRPSAEDFTCPAIARALDAIGGIDVVRLGENPAADRAHFMKAYDQIIAREKAEGAAPPIVAAAVRAIRDKGRADPLALPEIIAKYTEFMPVPAGHKGE